MPLSRRRFLAASAGVLFAPPSLLPSGAELAVSTGKVDITPGPGTLMGGYGVETPRTATGTYRPLWARCTVLWEGATPHVIVTADVLGFGRSAHQAIRSRVYKLGLAPANFILTATHTHNGPVLAEKLDPYISYGVSAAQLAGIRAYTDTLAATIGDLVKETLALPRTTCTLDYQVAAETFSVNRALLPYTEREVPILVARSAAGDPLAVLFSYGCHPVAAGNQRQFDPDYPGEAVTSIEAETGAFAQFIQGPAGDQNPSARGSWEFRTNFGRSLGSVVSKAMTSPGRSLAAPIQSGYTETALPLDVTLSPANLAAVRRAYTVRKQAPSNVAYVRRHAEVMIGQIDAGTFATSIPLPLHRWTFSGAPDLHVLLTGGEVVSGYAVYLRKRHGGSGALLFGGYAGEVPAYIPSDELLWRTTGTYEGGITADFPGIAGGSMSVYGCLGHFRGRPASGGPDGVEQIYLAAAQALLGT